jgi:hypothetical protein
MHAAAFSKRFDLGRITAGLRGEERIAVLCCREGIAESLYYSWSKEFLEACKRQLSGDTARKQNLLTGHFTKPPVAQKVPVSLLTWA